MTGVQTCALPIFNLPKKDNEIQKWKTPSFLYWLSRHIRETSEWKSASSSRSPLYFQFLFISFWTISNIWPFFSFPLSFFLRAQIIVLMSISACMMIWQLTFKKICLITPYLQISRRSGSNLCLSVAQSCPTLCNPMGCSPLGSSLHGILQARYWSGLPFPSPADLPDQGSNHLGLLHCRQIFTIWATRI